MSASFLDRESTVAPAGYDRFSVPPAALAVHLSIGQAYAFSTFNLPLTKLIGINHSAPGDWKLTEVGWTFSIAIAILGLSAALFGRWVELAGPRKSMFTAALCFGGGFIVAAMGVHFHTLSLLYLGYGVLGGIGLGIGYISPVSTLIKWFPDRPGMATGMAIMGFGGGALIAAPLSLLLMAHFRTATSPGVMETFVTMGVIYFMFMMIGVYAVRVPAVDWKPAGWVAPVKPRPLVTEAHVAVDVAWKTRQFWLLWTVLCMNVTAGIGVLGQASPMIQEIFSGRVTPEAAGSFVGLLSLFNMGGRFVWATCPITSAAATPTSCSSGWASYSIRAVPTLGHIGRFRRSSRPSPSFFPCTAAASRPFRRICAICSALSMSGRSTAGCSPRGRSPASQAGAGELHSCSTRSTAACRRRRPTQSPCTSCAHCCWSACCATSACGR